MPIRNPCLRILNAAVTKPLSGVHSSKTARKPIEIFHWYISLMDVSLQEVIMMTLIPRSTLAGISKALRPFLVPYSFNCLTTSA